jgi:hypothetical protein
MAEYFLYLRKGIKLQIISLLTGVLCLIPLGLGMGIWYLLGEKEISEDLLLGLTYIFLFLVALPVSGWLLIKLEPNENKPKL